MKKILCVDFDGVVHSYTSGYKGDDIISDPPVKGALKWLWNSTEWFDVQIYSSRSKNKKAVEAMKTWMIEHSIIEFGPDHPMCGDTQEEYPITFAHEKPPEFLTIDDRAITFEGNWEELEPYSLLNFKPWNERR